jgi:hypothetical protein
MILSAHQLNYLPYAGLLSKINSSDKFLYLSKVQFEKKSWQSRNRILSKNKDFLLSVPVINKNVKQLIADVRINNKINWKKKHLKSIEINYSKTKYFNDYINFFRTFYEKDWIYLAEMNEYFLKYIIQELQIKTEILSDRDLNFKKKKNDFIIEICNHFKANEYLSNKGSEKYIDLELFKKNKINHYFVDYHDTDYRNQTNLSVTNLSVIDMLFHCGSKKTSKIIKDNRNLKFSKNYQFLK